MKAWLTRDEDKTWLLWPKRPDFCEDFEGWDGCVDRVIDLKPSAVPAHLRRRKGGPAAIWRVNLVLECEQ